MAGFIEMVCWSPSSIRYFTSCLFHSAVPGLHDMDTKDYCVALTSSRLSRWDGMERHLGTDFCSWQVIKGRQFTNVNIFCLCFKEKKPEALRLHEIISAQNHSSHVFFNKWYENLNINYCLCSFAVIFYRSKAVWRTNIHQKSRL